MHIYSAMLGKIQDFDKLQLAQRLCQEVLGAIADETLLMSPEVEALLGDTLEILSSDAIKLRSRGGGSAGDDGEDPDLSGVAKVAAKAKATLITKVVKKNVVENIVPIVIGLKAHLERLQSPMMGNLMGYLRQLFNEYKDEVRDIMAADKQLGNEILYDIRKYEAEVAQATKTAAAAKLSAAAAAAGGSPRRPPRASGGGGGSPFGTPGLRDASPQGSPLLLSPSLLASAGKPGSPAFKAPQLRCATGGRGGSFRKSRLSVVAAADMGGGGTLATGSPRREGGGGSALKPIQTAASGAARTPVIKIANPGGGAAESPAWQVKVGAAKTIASKRYADLEEAADDADELLAMSPDAENDAGRGGRGGRRVQPRMSRRAQRAAVAAAEPTP
jgi:hypothetical protein